MPSPKIIFKFIFSDMKLAIFKNVKKLNEKIIYSIYIILLNLHLSFERGCSHMNTDTLVLTSAQFTRIIILDAYLSRFTRVSRKCYFSCYN